ncbi:MAG: divalent metal cation transporter [Candidatus Thermochlorobacter aerophilum]|jgi:Mn2+/Fe2+ NRAMP family transporter|uniref:Divalent metal cation transporter n=1 Tax=Candidatus Thermochlorobacter aerophilus TaxID=1868324 RepID=A0A395LY87_9BACT|nr:MAG: divalent metal cation transporter [Candidatus Thermochlorobacter aerophilum]
MVRREKSAIWGAAFLMATSAIGPGFLTQTAFFTESIKASFGFAILISVLIDVVAQLNIWRIIAITELHAQEIANRVLFGLGSVLTLLIGVGGFAFNVGNVAGAGLGMNVLFGLDTQSGAIVSAIVAIGIFLFREMGKAIDVFVQLFGAILILLTLYIAFAAKPPLAEVALKTVLPDRIDVLAILTLVGGTVGGYITFAGGHRLLDAGITGKAALPEVEQSAVSGILVTALMRSVLFLAAIGIVAQGLILDKGNPAASVFELAAGKVGYKFFGMVLWSAALTSIVGSAYTTVSFLETLSAFLGKHRKGLVVGFIVLSTAVFVSIGKPVKILIAAGALNGVILPLSLGVMVAAAYRRALVGDYKHPTWLAVSGVLVVILMSIMSVYSIATEVQKLF